MGKVINNCVRWVVPTLAAVALAGCEWAPLTRAGEGVTVAKPEHIQTCRRLGETSAQVKRDIAGVARDSETIAQELQNLGRNAAAGMHGDTIVPVAPPHWGEQRFTVYRCRAGR